MMQDGVGLIHTKIKMKQNEKRIDTNKIIWYTPDSQVAE